MKKKNNNIFLKILSILFLFYMSMYISSSTSIIENKRKQEVIITEKNIKRFENDIKNNKNIDINDYMTTKKNDYSGPGSRLGENVSNFFEDLLTKQAGKMAKFLKKCFFN